MSASRWIRRSAVALLVAAAIALVGCGGGDGEADAGGADAPASTTAAAPPPFDPQEAVIALSDLPSGWAVDPDDEDDEDEDFCGRGESVKSLVGVESVGKAEAQFAEGGSIPVLVNALGAYAPGDADTAFDRLRGILADCPSFESDGTTFDIAPVSFPEVGDESVPLLFSGEVEGFTIGFYFVIARVEDGITIVGYGGLAPDVSEAERFARLAVTKLEEAQGLP